MAAPKGTKARHKKSVKSSKGVKSHGAKGAKDNSKVVKHTGVKDPSGSGSKDGGRGAKDGGGKSFGSSAKKWVPTDYRKEFNGIVREIRDLSMPHINKFAARDYETKRIMALGGKIGKQEKMSFPKLLKYRQKARENIAKELEEEKETGVKIRMNKYISVFEAEKVKKKRQHKFKELAAKEVSNKKRP